MKLSMEQAAQVIGKTKKTIYNHKDRNKFSYEQDEEGRAVIDVSELLRVYGSTPEIAQRLEELQSGSNENVITQDYTAKKPTKKSSQDTSDYKMQIVRLEAELEKEKAIKIRAEDEVEYFKSALEKSQETAQKVTLLLEDKSNSGAGEWQQSLKALEARIANQEKSAKEDKERADKILRQNRALKQALDAEKNKSIWKKIFG